jgi:hypothetical protein
MVLNSFSSTIKRTRFSKKYIFYSVLFGLTNLIVPMAVQFVVNNLALSGIWINIVAFMVIISIGLTLSQILKHCQVILKEYLQRELFYQEVRHWKKQEDERKRIYFGEIFISLKSFSKSFTSIVEIALVSIMGLVTIMIFHPAFIILPILIGGTLYHIKETTKPAVQSSILESDKKYDLFEMALNNELPKPPEINLYLEARHEHFIFVKNNTFKMSILYIVCQIILLGGGTWLVEIQELSIGQLVSSEIILSGIMVSLNKLPEALESLYDYETSTYKIKKAKGEIHA